MKVTNFNMADFPDATTRRIRKDLMLGRFDHKLMAIYLLKIGIAVAKLYNGEQSLSHRGMQHAVSLAKKSLFKDISSVATKNIRKSSDEDEAQAEIRIFLHKCLSLSTEEIKDRKYAEYFDQVTAGLTLIQQQKQDVCYADIFCH